MLTQCKYCYGRVENLIIKFSLVALLTMGALPQCAFGQGTVNFNNGVNFVTVPTGTSARPVYYIDGATKLVGTNFLARLYYALGANQPEASLHSISNDKPSTFFAIGSPNAGKWIPSNKTIPDASTNQTITLQVLAWNSGNGAYTNYEAALAAGMEVGKSSPFNYIVPPIGGYPAQYYMEGFQSFQLYSTNIGVSSPPVILTNPASQLVTSGAMVAMNVTASGQEPLAYFWRKDGVKLNNDIHIGGATTAVLTISNAQYSDVGGYSVMVANSFGSVTSLVANLTVLFPPYFTNVADTQIFTVGSVAMVQAPSGGTPPVQYQWQFNGLPVSGATNPVLTLSAVQITNAGAYQLNASNAYGAATSPVVNVVVKQPPIVTNVIASTRVGTSVAIPCAKLLAAATDPQGYPLKLVSVVTISSNAFPVVYTNFCMVYQPATNFVGQDSIGFSVADNFGGVVGSEIIVNVLAEDSSGLNIRSITQTNASFEIGFMGMLNRAYSMQWAPRITGPWLTIGSATANAQGEGRFYDTNLVHETGFYRVIYP